MSEVKRYGNTWCEVTERTVFKYDQQDGDYVKLSDYASLQEQLTNAQEALKSVGIEADTVQAGVMELVNRMNQVVAENAALKSNLMFWDSEDPEIPYDHPEDIANNCAMEVNTVFDVQVVAKMPNRTYRVSEVNDYDCTVELVSGGMPETPATDAYLNAVRAEGAVMLSQLMKENGHHHHAAGARAFAAQLRAGNAGKDGV